MRGISVIMPTFNQGAFISRSIASLKLQTFANWELIILNDGSSDYTDQMVVDYLGDQRVRYFRNECNLGLGACLNQGIELSSFDLIAYLPSDDIYFADHLQSLHHALENNDKAVLAYSGLRHNYSDSAFSSSCHNSTARVNGQYFQLVQVLHLKTDDKWIERDELVTDDLDRMFFTQFLSTGEAVATDQITCEWVDHPMQRHKFIRENSNGGIYAYKQYYNVKQPLRFHSTAGSYINEPELYKNFRENTHPETSRGLKILLVGELSFNPERIYALEQIGHTLYGLWVSSPTFYNSTGPLAFGNIQDIPSEHWLQYVNEIKPDIIYALLNHRSVSLAHHVLMNNPGIPFVWHFKEGPFFCRQNGTWNKLLELYVNSDGQIYINQEAKDWFKQFLSDEGACSFVLDGDLPKQDWFSNNRSPLLSDNDGEIHTLIPGRPLGITSGHIKELANEKIHVHFYGDFQQTIWKDWIKPAGNAAAGFLHTHHQCHPKDWVSEFSKYDAGWLHVFDSENNGELMRATWNDLNNPARMATLAAAGLPMIQKDNTGHIVATQALNRELDLGVFFSSIKNLCEQLRDKKRIKQIRENVWNNRMIFSFDHHAEDLVSFFRRVIEKKK